MAPQDSLRRMPFLTCGPISVKIQWMHCAIHIYRSPVYNVDAMQRHWPCSPGPFCVGTRDVCMCHMRHAYRLLAYSLRSISRVDSLYWLNVYMQGNKGTVDCCSITCTCRMNNYHTTYQTILNKSYESVYALYCLYPIKFQAHHVRLLGVSFIRRSSEQVNPCEHFRHVVSWRRWKRSALGRKSYLHE
jgi:hypothetical protein